MGGGMVTDLAEWRKGFLSGSRRDIGKKKVSLSCGNQSSGARGHAYFMPFVEPREKSIKRPTEHLVIYVFIF